MGKRERHNAIMDRLDDVLFTLDQIRERLPDRVYLNVPSNEWRAEYRQSFDDRAGAQTVFTTDHTDDA